MSTFEVPTPILNTPYREPTRHWYVQEGEEPQLREGRRPSLVFPPEAQRQEWDLGETLFPSSAYPAAFEMVLVNLIRQRVKEWRLTEYAGITRTTRDLLRHWTREGRKWPLFYAQFEAVETIIFLTEARRDLLQGVQVPPDEPGNEQQANGGKAFTRYACKMATGSGKTTVMGMLAAWSILNKVNDRTDARFSDVVLVVCPNVTIRDRLRELDPAGGEASIYRTRDLVPPGLATALTQGRVLVTNWHVFEPQSCLVGEASARVVRTGRPVRTRETITIGPKTTSARGTRYLSREDFERQKAAGMIAVLKEHTDPQGNLKKVEVESRRYVESDTGLLNRILGREVGGKRNILVLNDEAHHAYRIRQEEADDPDAEEDAEELQREATVWVEGLDRVHRLRGINVCVDLSATPYFLGAAGRDTGRPFPWVVSDFGLIDAIEAGLVKIPQLAVRDTTGAAIPGYFNVWDWIMPQLTPAERGGRRANPKPEAILKYANHPIAMLAGLWERDLEERARDATDPRPPVFILVCKNTKLAKVVYEWLAEDVCPPNIPPAGIPGFRNHDGTIRAIRVDSKVAHEMETDQSAGDEVRRMRFTLDTVGKREWPADAQGRPIYPAGFEDLAGKMARPLHPPGRDVRCIVSVGMLTEGWDCNTVSHIIGLRPFLSQLLCEQVVGRGLRRRNYAVGDDGLLAEEVAKVFGVPFEIIPFKTNSGGPTKTPAKKVRVHAIPERERYAITFPRVEGYSQAIHNRVTVDWESVPSLVLRPDRIPPEVQMKGLNLNTAGRPSLTGPGRLDLVSLREFRASRRLQELTFDLARGLTREYVNQGATVPAHALFPQLLQIVQRYLTEKVRAEGESDVKDVFLSPYYGWVIERLSAAIRADSSGGLVPERPRYEENRAEGSTADVDFWTAKEVVAAVKCHINYVVADTAKWEQSAAYAIDRHPAVAAFVKNEHLYFAVPYLDNGQAHEYYPDFLIRLEGPEPVHLILETKGYDPLAEVKRAAAERWVSAVNAEGSYGRWCYVLVRNVNEVGAAINEAIRGLGWGSGGPGG